MKLVPLSQTGKKNKGKFFAQIDDEDYQMIKKFSWHASRGKNTYYAQGYRSKTGGIPMHRLIMKPNSGQIIDHIDGDGLNNQKSNLRYATFSQNNTNRILPKNKLIKFKGVSAAFESKTFRVRVGVNKKSIYIGSFKTEIDAAKAYNEAAKKLHGEFARLNVL